jgi:hypothetical protein
MAEEGEAGQLFAAIQDVVHSIQKEFQDYPLTVFCKHIHQPRSQASQVHCPM